MRGVSKDYPVGDKRQSRHFGALWSALRGRFAAPQDEGRRMSPARIFFAAPLAFPF
jgi:hypothetical protein